MTKEGNISTRNSQLDSFAVLVSEETLLSTSYLGGSWQVVMQFVQFVRFESVEVRSKQ